MQIYYKHVRARESDDDDDGGENSLSSDGEVESVNVGSDSGETRSGSDDDYGKSDSYDESEDDALQWSSRHMIRLEGKTGKYGDTHCVAP